MKFVRKIKDEFWVFLIFVVSRVPSLGSDFFNTDVWKWKTRTYGFSNGVFTLDFAQTLQKYHPGVTLMWIGTFAVKIYNLFYDLFYKTAPQDNSVQTVFELHLVQKLLIVCVLGVTIAFGFHVLKSLFGREYAYLVLVLLILEPFYTALTRVVHLEGLMATFMLVSFLWFYYFLVDPRKRFRLVISGIFGSLALLTKTSALFLLPFMGFLSWLWYFSRVKSFFKAVQLALKVYWKWLLALVLGFVALWPAMWVIPLEAFSTLFKGIFTIGVEGGHDQIYFGKFVSDPGISFYFVVLLLRVSVYVLLGVVGYFAFMQKRFSAKIRSFAVSAFLFSFLYLVQITIPSKKLDRYLLPSILGFVLIAAFFYQWILDRLKSKKIKFLIAASTLFLPGVLTMVLIHPDYFSYFNPVFGGLNAGVQILEPKWIIGQHEIVEYLVDLKKEGNFVDFNEGETVDNLRESVLDTKLVVGFQEKYYAQIWPFLDEVGVRGVIKDMTPHAKKANYFMYPVWADEAEIEDRFKLEFVGSVKVRGVELWRVYKRV